MARRLSLLVVLAVGGTVLLAPGVAAGRFCHPDKGAEMTTSDDPSIMIDRCAFGDAVTYVEPGETVRWTNKDVYPHSVTGAALSWGNEDLLDQGMKVSYSFAKEGVYPYYCALHPTMVGAIVVGDGGAPGAGAASGVEAVDDAAPTDATGTTPVETDDGMSPAVLALAVAAALGAVAAVTRYALGRRAGVPSAP